MNNKTHSDITINSVLKAISKDFEYGLSLMDFKSKKLFNNLELGNDRMLKLRDTIFVLVALGFTEYKINYV